ncbi:MAG: VTT domain-containing protein [Lysobacteraceae bacterium]
MAHEIIALISHYGLLVVFLSVLVDQLGLPVPGLAVLVVAGALAVTGQMSLPAIFLVALVACLLADFTWYGAGRYLGARVLRMLCRISLSPDSCVNRSELSFERWRGKILLVAKFIPGLSMVAPPLAGAMGLRPRVFLLFDGLGSLLWVGVWVGLGYVFAAQIDDLLTSLTSAGKVAIDLVLGVLAVFIFIKWWHRRRLLIELRMPRITVAELKQSIEAGLAPLIVDVRSAVSRKLDPWIVDGALLADPAHIEQALAGIPLDRPLVIYCNCPNEATSARAAKRLIAHGYRDVQPLRGGLAEWKKKESPIQRLSVAS